MSSNEKVIVVGLGEIGRPLMRILGGRYEVAGVDTQPVQISGPCSVLHICLPFQIPHFIETVAAYIFKYRPALAIINSTVAPGTTRKVQDAVGAHLVAYSPVRGKHVRMESDLLRYRKFVGAPRPDALQMALEHFRGAGFKTAAFRTPELGELSKLLETTALGILVGWAQEVERAAAQYGGTFGEVNAFIEEIDFLPAHIFPGHIGGHCVMPNIQILQRHFRSNFLAAVVESNERKMREDLAHQLALKQAAS